MPDLTEDVTIEQLLRFLEATSLQRQHRRFQSDRDSKRSRFSSLEDQKAFRDRLEFLRNKNMMSKALPNDANIGGLLPKENLHHPDWQKHYKSLPYFSLEPIYEQDSDLPNFRVRFFIVFCMVMHLQYGHNFGSYRPSFLGKMAYLMWWGKYFTEIYKIMFNKYFKMF